MGEEVAGKIPITACNINSSSPAPPDGYTRYLVSESASLAICYMAPPARAGREAAEQREEGGKTWGNASPATAPVQIRIRRSGRGRRGVESHSHVTN